MATRAIELAYKHMSKAMGERVKNQRQFLVSKAVSTFGSRGEGKERQSTI